MQTKLFVVRGGWPIRQTVYVVAAVLLVDEMFAPLWPTVVVVVVVAVLGLAYLGHLLRTQALPILGVSREGLHFGRRSLKGDNFRDDAGLRFEHLTLIEVSDGTVRVVRQPMGAAQTCVSGVAETGLQAFVDRFGAHQRTGDIAPSVVVLHRRQASLVPAAAKVLVGVALMAAALLLYPLASGASVCAARTNVATAEVPGALEVLSQRHPLRVGMLRSLLNSQAGMGDQFAAELIRMAFTKDEAHATLLECYRGFYGISLAREALHEQLADVIEEFLALKR